MITCPSCNNQIADDAKFCNFCGAQIPQTKICPHCGSQSKVENKFCPNCGKPMDIVAPVAEPVVAPITEPVTVPLAEQYAQHVVEPTVAPVVEAVVEQYAPVEPVAEPVAPAAPVVMTAKPATPNAFVAFIKKIPTKMYILGGIGVAALALIIVAAIVLTSIFGATAPTYGLYIKDGEIYYTDLSEDFDTFQITSDYFNGFDYTEDSEEYSPMTGFQGIQMTTFMADDGETLFFSDKMDTDDLFETFDLYYTDVTDPDAEATKIDSNVRCYHVNDDASLITYMKGNDGDLYKYSLDDDNKTKVSSAVDRFCVSEDGVSVIFLSEKAVYIKIGDENKEKLVGDIEELVGISDEFDSIFYLKEEALFEQPVGGDRVKIADDVAEAYVYGSDSIYYVKEGTSETPMINFVDDTLKASDDALRLPAEPVYPDYSDYGWDRYEEYQNALTKYYNDRDAYYEVYYDYQDKLERDELRAELADTKFEYKTDSLYYYDGESEVLVSDKFYNYEFISRDTPAGIFTSVDLSKIEKVKITDFYSIDSLRSTLTYALYDAESYNIVVKGTSSDIDNKNVNTVEMNDSATDVYYLVVPKTNTETESESDTETEQDYNNGELYHISIDGEQIGAAELYDDKVSHMFADCRFISDDKFIYFKEAKEDSGELYCNKKLVDYDVAGASYFEDADLFIYLTDFEDGDKLEATLKIYDDGEIIKIADEVLPYVSVSADGDVMYLTDYSLTSYKGELRVWNDGDDYKVDDDVNSFLMTYSNRYGSDYRFRGNSRFYFY